MGAPSPDWWARARVVVVVAHPDDEVLGCGALLAELRDVRMLHVTDGAPRGGAAAARHGFGSPHDYATARRREAEAALALAGLPPGHLSSLGIPDQEAPRHLATIARALAPRLADAAVVLTHAYEGGHGDHDAVAFAVRAAQRIGGSETAIVEMPFYYGDADGWVRQRFLPHPEAGPPEIHALSPGARQLKARMVAAHRSQAATLADFALDRERFRTAPRYAFRERPHDGPLLYERHGWSLTWPDWCAAVAAAAADLGLDDRC